MHQKTEHSHGNIRIVDPHYRVLLPKWLRQDMNILEGDEVIFNKVDNDTIMLSINRIGR